MSTIHVVLIAWGALSLGGTLGLIMGSVFASSKGREDW